VGLAILSLLVLGVIYDRVLGFIFDQPARDQTIVYLVGSPLGIGTAIGITIPWIGIGNAVVVFVALGLAALPITIGVVTRFIRNQPFPKVNDQVRE
jgi:hypothetical protein